MVSSPPAAESVWFCVQLGARGGGTGSWLCSFVPLLPLAVAELAEHSGSEVLALSDRVKYQASQSFFRLLLSADPITKF